MHFVGLDLAWGERRPTGVAVLDEAGRLVHVSAQSTDDTIVAAVEEYVEGPCLVAIDAPLVVANATGNRPCEAALNRDFRRFEAGAHPANTGKPEFAGVPRGARLAARLGLDIDPASTSERRAVEVYPHAATVALFRLGRTLKYKNRSGRSLADQRSELLRLVGLLDRLSGEDPPLVLRHHDGWRALVGGVAAAGRKSELRHAEDQVDAVVCAYVASFANRHPDRTTTYGDLASGYIVTPTLPADLQPAEPGAPAATTPAAAPTPAATPATPVAGDGVVHAAVQAYAARQDELAEVTERVVGLVTTLLDDAGINYLSVTGRAKSVASFAAKAARQLDGQPVYADPLSEITDQIGVRVITYLRGDVAAVAELLGDQLLVLDDRDMGQETASQGRFGYASRHLLVTGPDRRTAAAGERRRAPAAHDVLGGHRAQVQVRTVLQHAWAEFEHAIRYKGTIPEEHVPDLDRRFTLAAGLLELADREFTLIRDRLQATATARAPDHDPADPRIDPQDLATFLAEQYADAGWSRSDHYAWMSGLLLELGVTSLDELAGLVGSVDSRAVNARMGYQRPSTVIRRLDDALLAIFTDRYLALHGNAHRLPLLRARLEKLTAAEGG